jgi:hypothetical protein
MHTLIWILLVLLAMGTAWLVYALSRKSIHPEQSLARLLLFILFNMASVFLLCFILGLVIFRFKNYFFK